MGRNLIWTIFINMLIFHYNVRDIDFLDIIYLGCYKILELTNDFSDKQTN